MKTLVVHPEDITTTFLSPIYENIADKTVIRGGIRKPELYDMIADHDRIIMLGHGAPQGLMAVGRFPGSYLTIIDHRCADLLRTKTNNIYIWCHADEFVHENQLTGFYSGMFVSELQEADYVGLPDATPEMIEESNHIFGQAVSKHINNRTLDLYINVMKDYQPLSLINPVAYYNFIRINYRMN